ncbi:OmpP1/FadL family transporter [Thiothrix nivea]|uniref:Membrane protein involved in aromatic hydrocarbon degradation n=1 Tax=Thiothrix nivea (strain ATCC 35100 / DSM 5205 / JP2) TaxID=870187 RepID=A0A656HJG0_THINJ|nr:outer membrane protein transport protein [Thiothrix nivea]EIJ36194.1 membrane protein involved in aromatic hydrocarbon degradation [Thiothrix nivea DSM 5205]
MFRKTILASSVLLAIAAQPALATNGMAPTGLGQTHKAMGGAAAGYAANTMSMATNPASASFVEDGYDVALEVFKPNRTATLKAPFSPTGSAQVADGNGDEMFLIPEAGYKRDMKGGLSVGITAYGNGGMNTAYDNGVPFGPGSFGGLPGTPTGIDLKQLFIAPTASYRINDNVAVGASANLVYQRFEADGLGAFGPNPQTGSPGFSSDPTSLFDNGGDSSTGVGATVGIHGKVTDKLSAGLAYRSKVSMSKFEKYKGLFPDEGGFDVPAATTVGIAYKATPQTTIAADVEQIEYSKAQMGNSSHILLPFGSPGGPGFGWDDQTVYKLGVKHQMNDGLALMAGYNYGKNPISADETTVNVLAPGITEKHVSLGFEKNLTPKSKLVGSYIHAFKKTLEGDLNAPVLGGQVPAGAYDLEMDQDAIGLGYSVEF